MNFHHYSVKALTACVNTVIWRDKHFNFEIHLVPILISIYIQYTISREIVFKNIKFVDPSEFDAWYFYVLFLQKEGANHAPTLVLEVFLDNQEKRKIMTEKPLGPVY